MTAFYEILSDESRARLFEEMRRLDGIAQRYIQKGNALAAPFGTISVGGADFDEILDGTIIEAYLRALRKGAAPIEAKIAAEQARDEAVEKFNRRRGKDYVVRRSTTSGQAMIDIVHRSVEGAAK